MPATIAHVTLSTGFASRILNVDEAFAAMTGWPPEEANGQTLGILFGPWSNQQAVDRLLRALERAEGTDHLALKLYRHDGATFDAAVSLDVADAEPGQPRPATCTIRNRGEGAGAVEATPRGLAPPAADRLLPILMGSLRDAIVVIDEHDQILMVNRAFLDLLSDQDTPVGRPLAAFVEVRAAQGLDDDTIAAATIRQANGRHRSASMTIARGVDQLGRMFRVLSLRPSTVVGPPPGRRLDAPADVFERTLLKRVDEDHAQVAIGLIEIMADDLLEGDLGSIWDETLARARAVAAAVLAPELRPGELFMTIEDGAFAVLALDAATTDDAIGRIQGITQMVRQRLAAEGGAVSALEAFGIAMLVDRRAPAIALPRPNPPGELARRLIADLRRSQDPAHQVASIFADTIDNATIALQPVRGRDLAQARFGIAGFDSRSRRWLAWTDRRHAIGQRRLDELDIALLGRVVERSFSGGDFVSLIVPLRHETLVHAATADRMAALVRGLSQGIKARLQAMLDGLPADLRGERLLSFVRRLAGFGRGVWLVLDGFDARGIEGRHEGLAGVAFDYARLAPLIDRDPVAVKQFVERLRASNQPVLVFGVAEPAQATLLFNTFGVTLAAGAGVERLAGVSRES